MFTIEEKRILFKGGRSATFSDVVAEVIALDDVLVVRLENQGWKHCNENIFGVDYKGQILWQIEPRVHAFAESHYVNIYRHNENVDAYNWDGTILTLLPKTGEVVAETMVYTSTKRQTRKRQLI